MKKIWESDMHFETTKLGGLKDLKPAKDTYSCYDASNGKYLVEYKARRKFYDTTMIEESKLDRLLIQATKEGKRVLYVVYDGQDSIHYFNLTTLCEEDYDFKWTERQCPKTTFFDNNDDISKRVGEICWSKAMHKVTLG